MDAFFRPSKSMFGDYLYRSAGGGPVVQEELLHPQPVSHRETSIG